MGTNQRGFVAFRRARPPFVRESSRLRALLERRVEMQAGPSEGAG
jgi:hypothetical protein